MEEERELSVKKLNYALACSDIFNYNIELDNLLWHTMLLFQSYPFYTVKRLAFTYIIQGNELFITRKSKSITRSTVMVAFHKVQKLGNVVSGPKKLGTFGASYLYSIFIELRIIRQ